MEHTIYIVFFVTLKFIILLFLSVNDDINHRENNEVINIFFHRCHGQNRTKLRDWTQVSARKTINLIT